MKSRLFLMFLVFVQLALAQDLLDFPGTSDYKISFIENKGQVHDQNLRSRPDVLFSGDAGKLVFHLRNNGVSYQIPGPNNAVNSGQNHRIYAKIDSQVIYRVDINWIDANLEVKTEKGDIFEGYNNYYNSSYTEGIHHVRSYKSVLYKNIYNGIDLKWHSEKGVLEYDFIIAPHIDYKQIRMQIHGATETSINDDGDLVIGTPYGQIVEKAPLSYQNDDEIESYWKLEGNQVSFLIGNYNPDMPLIIDPAPMVRIWGTYYGGSSTELPNELRVDKNHNVYICGDTKSTNAIATSGAHKTTLGAAGISDAFLVKFNGNGVRQWGTYYGTWNPDEAFSLDIDDSLNVYMTGFTWYGGATYYTGISTPPCHQDSFGGGTYDGFLVKFNSSGQRIWGTYYGGSGEDYGQRVRVIHGSHVILSGRTKSSNAIATVGSYQSSFGGGSFDAFMARFDGSGNRIWSTYYGGSGTEEGIALSVDKNNRIYLCGSTSSSGMAVNGHQNTLAGINDAYLAKFNSNGGRIWATYYGGTSFDNGINCSADDSLHVYLTGKTRSYGLATPGSHQSTHASTSYEDAYLVKFDSNGTRKWATYYGSQLGTDEGKAVMTDAYGYVYLLGTTNSTSKISTYGSMQDTLAGSDDCFLVKFNQLGIRKTSTYYGGTSSETAYELAHDTADIIYMLAHTFFSANLATLGSHQSTLGSWSDPVLVKFRSCIPSDSTIYISSCESYTSPSGKFTWTQSGIYLDSLINNDNCDSLLTIHLTINDSDYVTIVDSACFEYISPSGNIYTNSGTYYDTLYNMNGCDSVVEIILKINTVNTSIIGINGTLTAEDSTAQYQWINCDSNFALISGATARSFTPGNMGNYAVIILNEKNCTDTSNCVNINNVGIRFISIGETVKIFPNPAREQLFISSATGSLTQIQLKDISGKIVLEDFNFDGKYYRVDVSRLNPGMYLYQVVNSKGQVVNGKVMVE